MDRDTIAQVLGQLDRDAIVGANGGYRIVFFNQGAETVFGYRAGDNIIGRPVSTLLPVTTRFVDAGEGTDPVGALWPLADGKPRWRVAGLRKSGEESPLEAAVSAGPLQGEQTLVLVLRDITEQVATERRRRYPAEHEPLPSCPTACSFSIVSTRPVPALRGMAGRRRCSTPMWTGSSRERRHGLSKQT
jgi:hypothetical protein